jgi:hypothetical protein
MWLVIAPLLVKRIIILGAPLLNRSRAIP